MVSMQWIIIWSLKTSLNNFEEAYCGEVDSEEDSAQHIIKEYYNRELEIAEYLLNKLNMKQKMMGSLANYFDYEAFARELINWDYNMQANGHVFRRI